MPSLETLKPITKTVNITDLIVVRDRYIEGIPPPEFTEGLFLTKVSERIIETGNDNKCECCNDDIKYRARHRDLEMIINFFHTQHTEEELDNKDLEINIPTWLSKRHIHDECYEASRDPFGEVLQTEKTHIIDFTRELTRFQLDATVKLVENAFPR